MPVSALKAVSRILPPQWSMPRRFARRQRRNFFPFLKHRSFVIALYRRRIRPSVGMRGHPPLSWTLCGGLRKGSPKMILSRQTAKALSVQLEAISKLWQGQAGTCDKLSRILGITPPKGENAVKAQERRETAAKVAALVLANALIFQEQLAPTNLRVSTLTK